MYTSTQPCCIPCRRQLLTLQQSRVRFVFLVLIFALSVSAATAQLVRSAAGPDAASIIAARDQFRIDLGGGNTPDAGFPGRFGGVRREINWDGVPNGFSAPNNLPGNFFNVNSPRGVVFSTPGTGFQVSANAGVDATEFGNIDPSYPAIFGTFSPQRLFTALGSTITDVSFFLPGTTTPALTRGFGVVFTDVDVANATSIEFFDMTNNSLGTFFAPAIVGQETFSFLGVSYPTPMISRVRITSGNAALSPGTSESIPSTDLVVMDDFIFGEPALLRWYRDFDGDGFGDPNRTMTSATQPTGFVSNNQDCNDYRTFYQDNDNDGWGSNVKVPCGMITRTGDCDDNNNKVHTPQTFYRDADGDSWGDAATTTVVCSSIPPTGYVKNRMDCNDNDRAIRYCPPPVTSTGKREGLSDIAGTTTATLQLSAFPNPFAGATRIQYFVPAESQVRIQVIDVLGREIGLVFNGKRSAGTYYAEYNANKLPFGVYHLRMTAIANNKAFIQTQKLVKAE